MAEEVTSVNETRDSILSSLNEVGKLFGQFFGLLLSIMGFAAMNHIHPIMMMALVFMVALFYLVLVLVTMFELQIQSFLPSMMVILLLGSFVSFLALIIISPTIAGIHLGLWFLIFALMCYKYQKELYQMILKMFKIANSEIPAVELGSFQSRENLNV
ncbi:hypothetical protein P8452_63853 [Trifolium repens]|nr:hypothetical protein P8452_63853 [Trifolium repens]